MNKTSEKRRPYELGQSQRPLTPEIVLWLFAHGLMPWYTPVAGSCLNMAESIQRILVRRAFEGQSPQTTQQIIDALEVTA